MRIQNNIMAMNTHRFYTINNNSVSKSAEKLSSGYRVNRAGDDAAGLAISEKMRAEIRGLTMASKNAQDGVSMVQTAEGALTEVHSMLQRMKELAVQAASDSNENEVDRPALEQEFSQLLEEIDDVAESTTFNDMKLLDGTFTDKHIQIGSRTGNELGLSIGKMSAFALGLRDAEAIEIDTPEGGEGGEGGEGAGGAGTATKAKMEVSITSSAAGTPGAAPTANGTVDVAFTAGDATNASKYVLDFTNGGAGGATVTAPTDGSTGAKASIQFNGATYDAAVTASDDLTSAEFASAIATAMGSEVTINGVKYGVTDDGAGKITLEEQTDNPGTYANITSDPITAGDITPSASAGTIGGNTDYETGKKITFTSTGGTVDANIVAEKTADGWTVTGAPSGYDATFDGTKLTLTKQEGGAVADASPFGTWSVSDDDANTNAALDGTGTWTNGGAAVENQTQPQQPAAAPTLTGMPTDLTATDGTTTAAAKFEVDFTGASLSGAGAVKMTISGVDITSAELADADKADPAKIAAAFNGKTFTKEIDGTTHTFTAQADGNKVVFTSDKATTETTGLDAALGAVTTAGVAATGTGTNDANTAVDPNKNGKINLLTQENASNTIDLCRDAINLVSTERAKLGAIQNRLEHKITNLDNTVENVSAAESRIRDVDIAKEMTNFTKNQILSQAATAMLAQANALPQGVLSLLQ